jgi:hypothetical protein
MPIAKRLGQSSPLAPLFGHIQYRIEDLQVAQRNIAVLARQKRFDALVLRFGKFRAAGYCISHLVLIGSRPSPRLLIGNPSGWPYPKRRWIPAEYREDDNGRMSISLIPSHALCLTLRVFSFPFSIKIDSPFSDTSRRGLSGQFFHCPKDVCSLNEE